VKTIPMPSTDLGIFAALTIFVAPEAPTPARPQEAFDALINHGRVLDPGAGYAPAANVGITGSRITVVTQKAIAGRQLVDARGFVVAPSFIGTHVHWARPLCFKLALRDLES